VQPDAEAQLRPSFAASARTHCDLLGDLRGRLAPGQVDVGVLGRDRPAAGDEPPK
jgi:hypothetical protein